MAPSQALTPTQPRSEAPSFTLRTLGAFVLSRPSEGPLLGPGKPLALVAYLHALPGRIAPRDHLLHILWSDVEEARARHALRQTIWHLRQFMGDDAFDVDVGTVALRASIHSDFEEFLLAVERGRLADAVTLYAGEFLTGFFVPGALGFEHWADTERQRYRLLFQRSAESVARKMLGEGKLRSARELAKRMRDAEPLDETAWRLLLQAALATGDRVTALAEAQQLEESLTTENRKPEPATRALLAEIRAGPSNSQDGEAADLVADLVGRHSEFSALAAALRRSRRSGTEVVEIVGPAGFGKTRLLRDFARHADAHGYSRAYVRALPGDCDLAWSYAAEVVRHVAALPGALGVSPAAAATLVGLDSSLSSVWTSVTPETDADAEVLRRRVAALEELVRTVTDEQPLALLLDDLHWADAVSREALERAFARLHNAHLLAVVAHRTGAAVTLTTTQQTIQIEPLNDEDAAALVASLGETPSEPWAIQLGERVRKAADGSPLLMLETLRLALDAGCLTLLDGRWGCTDPAALDTLLERGGALARRIARLDDSEQRALLVLAVARARLPATLLATALGAPAVQPSGALARLERRGLVGRSEGGWSVVHDELAEAALDRATPEDLASAHDLLGRMLMQGASASSDLRRAAKHFVAAESGTELRALARRWVHTARSAGDARAVRHLVADLIAPHNDDTRVDALVSSLPWRLRWRRSWSVAAAGLTAATVLSATLVTIAPLGTDDPPLTVATWKPEGGGWRMYTRYLKRDDLVGGVIQVRSLAATELLAPDRPRGAVRPGVTGTMVTTRAFPDSGGEDVVLVSTGSRSVTRLTTLPGDDVAGDWSPDGRYLVIQTDRWSDRSMSDIAVIDPDNDGALVARLTREPMSRDVWPLWSPDGTRVAFLRVAFDKAPNEGSAICVVSVDGAAEVCLRVVGHSAGHLLAWASPVEVVGLFDDSVGVSRILVVNTETGERRNIAEGGYTLSQSHSPGWLYCFCRRRRSEPFQALIMSVDRPDAAVRLEPGDPPPQVALFAPEPNRAHLQRVRIARASRPLPADGEYQLRLQGWDAAERPLEPLGVRWTSRDTTIAEVTSGGIVRPRRPGRTMIWVSAGGWRSDSTLITIAPADTVTVLQERWTEDFDQRWAPYGLPRSLVVRSSRGAALAPNGDSTFLSGVYLRRVLPTHEGVGVAVDFSAPTTSRSWQVLYVKIVSKTIAELSRWDHQTGQIPGAEDRWQSCAFSYPQAGRRDQLALQAGISRALPVRPDASDGAWVRVRLQIFEDGRCGIAVNDQPLAVIERAIPMGDSAVFMIGANSHRTRILVGPVSVWLGVRRDVNWQGISTVSGVWRPRLTDVSVETTKDGTTGCQFEIAPRSPDGECPLHLTRPP